MATADNISFASPLADANYAQLAGASRVEGLLSTLSELSGWTIALTLLVMMVAYDQCERPPAFGLSLPFLTR